MCSLLLLHFAWRVRLRRGWETGSYCPPAINITEHINGISPTDTTLTTHLHQQQSLRRDGLVVKASPERSGSLSAVSSTRHAMGTSLQEGGPTALPCFACYTTSSLSIQGPLMSKSLFRRRSEVRGLLLTLQVLSFWPWLTIDVVHLSVMLSSARSRLVSARA